MLKRFFSIAAFVVLAISCLLTPTRLQAQGLNVGYTDHGIIILNMPRYQAIQEELQQEYMGSQEALQSLYVDYQEDVEKYEKQAPLLSAESRATREQELLQKQQDIQDAATRKDEELAKMQADKMQPLLDQVQDAIDSVAQEKGLDIVLRAQVGTEPLILYVDKSKVVDITLDVARRLGIDVSEAEAPTSCSNQLIANVFVNIGRLLRGLPFLFIQKMVMFWDILMCRCILTKTPCIKQVNESLINEYEEAGD